MGFGTAFPADEIWQKLTELAAGGDCRAMKLYYEQLEKQQKRGGGDIMQMAAIRRAVFGDEAVSADFPDTAASGEGEGEADTETGTDTETRAEDDETEADSIPIQ